MEIDHAIGMPATWTVMGFALQWLRQFRWFGDKELFPAVALLAFLGALPWHYHEGIGHVAMCAITGFPAILGGTFIGARVSQMSRTPLPTKAEASLGTPQVSSGG